jgi:hypothetical protein
VLWRSLVNEVRRDGLLGVLVMLLVKGSLLVIGVMSGKINRILICDPELFVTFGKLLTKGTVLIVWWADTSSSEPVQGPWDALEDDHGEDTSDEAIGNVKADC